MSKLIIATSRNLFNELSWDAFWDKGRNDCGIEALYNRGAD